MMTNDHSVDTEKEVLAGILQHKEELFKHKKILHKDLFYSPDHKQIFDVIERALNEERTIDPVTIASRLDQNNAKSENNKPLSKYVKAIAYSPPSENSVSELISQLIELHYRRKAKITLKKMAKELNSDKSLPEVYEGIQSIYVEGMKIPVSEDNKPKKIWKNYVSDLEERAANPEDEEEIGYEWPYKTVTDIYGKLRKGCVHVIVARGGVGKSTILGHVGDYLNKRYDLPILILDTEMETKVVQDRMFAAKSGASIYSIEENKWFKDEETKDKIYKAADDINEDEEIYHLYVGGKTIEEIEAMVLDFYYTVVGSGNSFALMYDYVKCAEGAVKNNWAEHQALGHHVDKLHQLARSLHCVVLTAAQANRTGESFGGNRHTAGIADDSTAIADSDRIQRYAEFVAILRTKTYGELALDEPDIDSEEEVEQQRALGRRDFRFGTHMFTVIKSRHGGRRSAGHIDFVRRTGENGQQIVTRNYVNLNINNFEVQDRGDLHDIIRSQSEDHDIMDSEENEEEDIF